ncbi:selenide, water dikinase SelD [Siminovitchia acidinfaciens]|uniref:Selenide, water dikinase n=1 Tax=Siminovitchia acidinfaciens TaxID=2321395 RepID=A0A429XVZ2_9BACI|nr:selenide, water dikinase SelD [Siminovitchia acidinfaciens]RST72523.1 selenide, water dikinase SelD [Siminovitchia acidinfaciens]
MTNSSKVKLTSLSSKGGCGCKIGPADLAQVLHELPPGISDPNLLVGLDTSDDAGVYRLNDTTAIVQTVDFFTPIVDDPYDFGQIAAANAISDVYAMGGKPITALNVVAFPIASLEKSILAEILKGAGDKLKEADAVLVGGHSIDDPEPKFGMAVTGVIHPDKVRTNAGAKPGDRLVLTKPIGVGIMTTSLKKGLLTEAEIDRVTKVMTTLNRKAAEISDKYTIHASTDVTGFGLLGHASEMAKGSGVGLRIYNDQVPKLERTKELAESGGVPGGTKNNFAHLEDLVTYPGSMSQVEKWILCDAVTSGGLLLSVAGEEAEGLVKELKDNGVEAQVIGDVLEDNKGRISVQ